MKETSRGTGPAFVSCWHLYEVMDFVSESVKHKRLVFMLNWIRITYFFCSTVTNFIVLQRLQRQGIVVCAMITPNWRQSSRLRVRRKFSF